MSTNLGLVKAIFRQSTSPVRTDVLWYDTINKVLKYFHTTILTWLPLYRAQLTGSLTNNNPTSTEISTIVGLTAITARYGFKVTIYNTNDNRLYFIESDGANWFYKIGTKPELVIDGDNNIYHIVTVGALQWTVEELRTTKYADGSSIPNITGSWATDTNGAYCYYNNDPSYKTPYGALYNWYAVTNVKGLAPTGWRVATVADWESLITSLGGSLVAGGKLKEVGTDHWDSPNVGATDEVGLRLLPCGFKSTNNFFNSIRRVGTWWTSDSYSFTRAYDYSILSSSAVIDQENHNKSDGYSVRFVRDISVSIDSDIITVDD